MTKKELLAQIESLGGESSIHKTKYSLEYELRELESKAKSKSWTYEELEEIASGFGDRSTWNRSDKHSHAFAKAQGWIDDLMPKKKTGKKSGNPASVLTDEIVIDTMSKYRDTPGGRSAFGRERRREFKYARANGLLDGHLPKQVVGRKPQP